MDKVGDGRRSAVGLAVNVAVGCSVPIPGGGASVGVMAIGVSVGNTATVGDAVGLGGSSVGEESGGKVGTRVRVGNVGLGVGLDAHATLDRTNNTLIVMASKTRLNIHFSLIELNRIEQLRIHKSARNEIRVGGLSHN